MEDNKGNQPDGSPKPPTKVHMNSSIAKQATIELQDFFANLIPEPIDTNLKQNMDSDELFSQLLASSISQGIDNYTAESDNNEIVNTSSKALQASSLIGRSVLVEDGYFYIECGQSALGRLSITDKIHHIFVYIENEFEDIVRIIPLGDDLFGEVTFTWNGVTRTGEKAPEGEYRFIVSCLSQGRVIELKPLTYNKIIRVSFERLDNEVRLFFENDLTMKLSDVVEILKE